REARPIRLPEDAPLTVVCVAALIFEDVRAPLVLPKTFAPRFVDGVDYLLRFVVRLRDSECREAARNLGPLVVCARKRRERLELGEFGEDRNGDTRAHAAMPFFGEVADHRKDRFTDHSAVH